MALTKEQKEKIKQDLSNPFGKCFFDIDGHLVIAEVQKYSALKYAIVVFVNNKIEYKKEELHPRFWFKKTKALHNKKQRDRMVKSLGKRRATEFGVFKSFELYQPMFHSPTTMLNTFIKNNKDVTLLTNGEGEARSMGIVLSEKKAQEAALAER